MKNYLFIATILSVCLTAIGCFKDIDNTPPPRTIVERPDTKISTVLHGVANDQDGNSIKGYELRVDEQIFLVDKENYKLNLDLVNKRNQHIAVWKNDQEVAFANVSLIENDYNNLTIELFPEWDKLDLTTGESIVLNEDSFQLSLAQNKFEGITELTTGTINSPNLLQQLGLWGRSTESENYFLDPLSAFYISSSAKIIGAEAMTVSLKQLSQNPDLGLFYLDPIFHQWILVDLFSNNAGSIQVANYGYYMLADFHTSSFVEGKVDYLDLPVAYQNVSLELGTRNQIWKKTTALGRWSSFVPNEILASLSLYDPCGEKLVTEEQIFDENQQEHQFILTSSNSSKYLKLKFKNVDCNGEIIINPSVKVNYGITEDLLLFGGQSVDAAIVTCGDLTIGGYDADSGMLGPIFDWNTSIEDELGILSACNDSAQGFSYLKINGEMELLPPFELNISQDRTILSLDSETDTIRISIKGNDIGSYADDQVNIYINDSSFGTDGYFMRCEQSTTGCGIDDCYVSHYESMENGFTRISFSGVLWMQTINNPTAGNYQIEGQILTRQ